MKTIRPMNDSGRLVYMNGKYVSEKDAKISIFDSALMFGDMVFEMTRSFNKKQFKLKEHLERLFYGIKIFRIPMKLSILDLERTTVNDIMIPRQEISGIDLENDWERILEQLRQTPHTRLPVYEGDIDNMIGLLHMKRVAQELARGALDREKLRDLALQQEPYFVPEAASLTVQLANFQRSRRRFAFVVDEYGDILGLVTLEDILEEIVGEFTTDPATISHKDIYRESNEVYIVNASATIRALNRSLSWQ